MKMVCFCEKVHFRFLYRSCYRCFKFHPNWNNGQKKEFFRPN